jgi:hypothetical protein
MEYMQKSAQLSEVVKTVTHTGQETTFSTPVPLTPPSLFYLFIYLFNYFFGTTGA